MSRKLATLSEDETRIIYLSAIPLWLEPEIMVVLYGSREKARAALQVLEQLLILSAVASNRAVVRPETRRYLLRAGWLGKVPDFAEVNQRLAEHCFQQLAEATKPGQRFRWARAGMYHLVAAGDASGWEWLARLFDDAYARGLAETTLEVIKPLRALRPLFSPEERAALAQYRARAALLGGNLRHAEYLFRAVLKHTQSPTLQGIAHRGLGQVLTARQYWSAGLSHLKQSVKLLDRAGESLGQALTWSRIGDLYQEMADFNGGITAFNLPTSERPWARRLYGLLYLPARTYQRLGHSLQRLPFIDVGFDYQNWVVARLMLAAARAYRRAERALADISSPETLYNLKVGRLRMFIQVGLLNRAAALLEELAGWEYVRESEYREAYVAYWQAELLRKQGQQAAVPSMLRSVLEVFERYQQWRGAAAVYRNLGMLAEKSGDKEAAVADYRQAARHYGQTEQFLLQTKVSNQVRELATEAEPEGDREQHYMVRYASQLAAGYRWLVFLLFFVFVTLLTFFLVFVPLALVENALALQQGIVSVLVFALLLSWPLLAFWAFQIVYLVSGLLISFSLPIGILGRDPPLRLILGSQGLTVGGGRKEKSLSIAWSALSAVQRVDYGISQHTLDLFSYSEVITQETRERIPALAVDYKHLLQDLRRHAPNASWQSFPFRFIPSTWYYVVMVFVVIAGGVISQVGLELGIFEGSPLNYQRLDISGVLLGMFIVGFLYLPLTSFWRLVAHFWRYRRQSPAGCPPPPTSLSVVLIHMAAVLWTLLSFVYVRFVIQQAIHALQS